MVRHVNPPPEKVTYSESLHKSSICQPKDNIGISGVFSAAAENIAARDKPSTGVRRQYVIPKDNLGVACLPTADSMRLRDIPEVSEYDSSEEVYVDTNDDTPPREKQESRSTITKITGRARCIGPKDNLSSSCRHINQGVAIGQVRLRAGEDRNQIQNQSSMCGRSETERVTQLKPKANVDFSSNHAIDKSAETFSHSNKKMQFKSSSQDLGISNIRRPKHDPTLPRKPIVPKDNLGLSGRHLQKSLIRSSGPKTSATHSLTIKKISNESERKESSAKSVSTSSEKRTATQNKSLKANHHRPK